MSYKLGLSAPVGHDDWDIRTYRAGVHVGGNTSDEEEREAAAAGQDAVASLIQARAQLLVEWPVNLVLSQEDMTRIMRETLEVAKQTEENLKEMIKAVPEHWEGIIRGELTGLRQKIDQAPTFIEPIAHLQPGTVVPGFRTWVDQTLARVENGVFVTAQVSVILSDWLRARALLTNLYSAAIGIIKSVVSLAVTLAKAGVGVAGTAVSLAAMFPLLAVGLLAGGAYLLRKSKGNTV